MWSRFWIGEQFLGAEEETQQHILVWAFLVWLCGSEQWALNCSCSSSWILWTPTLVDDWPDWIDQLQDFFAPFSRISRGRGSNLRAPQPYYPPYVSNYPPYVLRDHAPVHTTGPVVRATTSIYLRPPYTACITFSSESICTAHMHTANLYFCIIDFSFCQQCAKNKHRRKDHFSAKVIGFLFLKYVPLIFHNPNF